MAGWSREQADTVKAAFYEFLNHCEVKSKEKGWLLLGQNLYGAQTIVIEKIFDGLAEDIHDFKILKSRQLGVSTVIRALMCFWAGVFEVTGSLMFDTSQHLQEARQELVDMMERFPPSFQFPRMIGNNRYSITLSNKSRVNLVSAGTGETKASKTLGVGSAVSLSHRSELCNYGNVTGMETFRHSLARTNPNRLFIDESTAKGFNLWYDLWIDGKKDPHCKTIFCGWWSHPDQRIPQDDPDFQRFGVQPLSDLEKQKVRQVYAQYGHEITAEQIAWIRREMNPVGEADGDAEADFDGDPTRLEQQPWCVTAETRVGTSAGMVRIVDARVGMEGTLGPVTMAGQTGTARIWRAETRLGYTIRGTANHPLINVERQEIDLAASLGQHVILQPPRFADAVHIHEWREGPVVSRVEITPDFARLVGLYMGDGSLQGAGKNGGAGYFAICGDGKDIDVLEEVRRLLRDTFGVDSAIRQQGKQSNCYEVRVGSDLIVKTFRKLGLVTNEGGPTRRKVHVPEFIFRSPKHVVKEFLSGLFEADGWNGYDTHQVVFCSKYPDFIRDVQRLLLAFGITSRAKLNITKKLGDARFTSNHLMLRKAEAIAFNEEIGFLSRRKRERHTSKEYHPKWLNREKPTIRLSDEIVSVVDEGITEPVYNLTIEGDHLFDANGILTHNTEEDSFQMTGAVFFNTESLTEQVRKNVSRKYKTYSYTAGMEFSDFRVFPAPNAKSVELKVWEEPVEESVYIISADVAFGRAEYNDRSAIQVLRCFADGVDQVAEYAWAQIDSKRLAWVILSLAGWYAGDKSEVYQIVDINGPGEATWMELQTVRHQLQYGYFGSTMAERGLQNIQRNVRNYIYTRSDSMKPGAAWQFKAQQQLKVAIMERLRDHVTTNQCRIRSMDALEEMRSVTRDGDKIEAQGHRKDDRVYALAMGIRCWEDRARRQLVNAKRTRDYEASRRRLSIVDQVGLYNTAMFESFLSGQSMQRQKLIAAARRQNWRGR